MLDMRKFAEIEDVLRHVYARPELLELALTHSSWANEHGLGQEHNERQEFLGDAVLELCVSWELFSRFPEAREGDLTRMRARLVSTAGLAGLARELGLDRHLRLGRGEESQGGRSRDTVLSDVLEAVVASVYEDGGFAAASDVVRHIFRSRWPETVDAAPRKDYKTRLQEAMQHAFRERPLYALTGSEGPEHAKIFHVLLTLPDGRQYRAQGPSLKRAEQEAARMALEHDGE